MTTAEYFTLPGSPSPGSPVGKLVQKIMSAEVAGDFDEALQIAKQAILGKGGHDRLRQAWQSILIRYPYAKCGARSDYRWSAILNGRKTKRDRQKEGPHVG